MGSQRPRGRWLTAFGRVGAVPSPRPPWGDPSRAHRYRSALDFLAADGLFQFRGRTSRAASILRLVAWTAAFTGPIRRPSWAPRGAYLATTGAPQTAVRGGSRVSAKGGLRISLTFCCGPRWFGYCSGAGGAPSCTPPLRIATPLSNPAPPRSLQPGGIGGPAQGLSTEPGPGSGGLLESRPELRARLALVARACVAQSAQQVLHRVESRAVLRDRGVDFLDGI